MGGGRSHFAGNDWDHDWLIDQVDSIVVLPHDEFAIETLEQLLRMFSDQQEWIGFPWLSQVEMLLATHRLGRRAYAGDGNISRYQRTIVASGCRVGRGRRGRGKGVAIAQAGNAAVLGVSGGEVLAVLRGVEAASLGEGSFVVVADAFEGAMALS
ncbi:MAG: hypothetical protein AAF171_26895 [Cyanobacteria bacterium P01_A01_bin.116]